MAPSDFDLATALGKGDPEAVSALIALGADIRYRRDHGYGALLDAVHNRDVGRDPRLLDLLRLLVSHGVELSGISSHKESGLRVLSRLGRFDAIRLLLDAGADRAQLEWTPLIEAVALGSLPDVERLARAGTSLEEKDWWERTPWLMALLGGDLAKAKLLRDLGANTNARGRGGDPPLFYAIQGHHPEVLRWLLDNGQLVDQTDDFGSTPLMEAVDYADPDCLDLLISAGADVDHETPAGTTLHYAPTKEIVNRLLEAGADPRHLAQEGHRALCGLGAVHERLTGVAEADFRRARTRRFGSANPETVREPFWEAMVRAGISGYGATQTFDPGKVVWDSPVWSAMRFGQSITQLPDGRIVQIGGEHEDHYDPDFCIYNDVFVHGADGSIGIFGYPEDVFPPTDFHTATLFDDAIYVIGSLGYHGTRRFGTTPVHRLDVRTFRMDRIETRGQAPGWISQHRAVLAGTGEILVCGGQVATSSGGQGATSSGGDGELHTANATDFVLDVKDRTWRRQ